MRKASSRLLPLALFLALGLGLCVGAAEPRSVTLQLKNGDRLTGKVLSEDDERIVLSTPWNVAIFVPKSEVEATVETAPSVPSAVADSKDAPQPAAEAVSPSKAPAPAEVSTAATTPPKHPPHWKWNLKLGTDFVSGAKDRKAYFGQSALTYTRNYLRDPKQFLRNKLEYRVDYGETDGVISANRMVGANKLDFDIGDGYYGYGALGAGYDRVRKIEFQYEIGPGVGYHLLARKALALDTELGLNYQYREGLNGAPDREVIQARVAQELTWELLPKITLTEQVGLLPFLDELGEYQVRVEGNLGFGIVQHLSLNLSVMNLYDTQPAPGVPNNEFQFRSSLGVAF